MTSCEPGETVGAWLCQAGQVLRAAAIDTPRMEARWMLAEAMGTTSEALLREPRAPVPPEAGARFTAMLARRARREPLAYILGHAGFWGLDFAVSPATLIPRADSETLVEAALAHAPGAARVLDLGTGTGCLLLAVLSEIPAAWGVGVDLRPGAAALAAHNAARLGLAGRSAFLAGEWAAALSGCFDLILSNPPYIEAAAIPALMPEVAGHEPPSALDGGADGLDAYRALAPQIARLLAPGGVAVLELGQGQGPDVSALMARAGLETREIRPDLGEIPRAMVVSR
ncbi:peptide chain release factor N(5)-glutamine methyltransferase [Rhodovarius lipocyclicus]|uniref:peptide chain release factor N(5)-glutamine methyltransferase n=1 Tax=Rhodovarius lipocyclicus TaxID=268410 RepID=UPI00135BCA82|nr:peptide chain release factor N(5)-glutamine methyltransferase [Rhodovarius lipocyclicus]